MFFLRFPICLTFQFGAKRALGRCFLTPFEKKTKWALRSTFRTANCIHCALWLVSTIHWCSSCVFRSVLPFNLALSVRSVLFFSLEKKQTKWALRSTFRIANCIHCALWLVSSPWACASFFFPIFLHGEVRAVIFGKTHAPCPTLVRRRLLKNKTMCALRSTFRIANSISFARWLDSYSCAAACFFPLVYITAKCFSMRRKFSPWKW